MPDNPTPSADPAAPLLELDTQARSATLHGQRLGLPTRAFDLLLLLAAQAGHAADAEHLAQALWPDLDTAQNNLRVQVNTLRKHLGIDAVRNLHGRGYVLTLPCQVRGLAPRCNLPHWADTLIGRDDDLATLLALMGEHRLVTVLGTGGIGKTRLAQQAAWQLARPPDGEGGCAAVWLDLGRLCAEGDTTAEIAKAVADAAGLQSAVLRGPGAGERLAAALAGLGPLLLLLDNAEHLADPLAPLLRQLLHGAPALRLLVTSQRTLPLPEAWAHWLPTLAVPPAGAEADDAAQSPAVQLLLRRAQAADARYQPGPADLRAAARLVRALDGIALAIEMAAARLPVLGMAELERRLDQRLNLLGQAPGAPGHRHQTLRATLDWSHALLAPAERVALRQLSVFAAPFRLAAAARVVAVEGLAETEVLQAIQGLVARSLLQPQPAAPGSTAAPRLHLLATTRLYAAEALQRSGTTQWQATRYRHMVAMAALAEQACCDFNEASDADWRARWLPDFDDFMAAFDRAHALGDAEAAAPLIEVLVLGANITGQLQPVLSRWQASRTLAEQAPPRARARLIGWGNLAGGPDDSRRTQADRRVQAWREVGEARGLCLALAMQAVVCEETGDPAGADAALAECESLQHPLWPARLRRRCSWLALTRMAIHRDDPWLYGRAQALSHTLIDELSRRGAMREATLVQGQLALMLRLQQRPLEAVALLQLAAQTQRALGCALDAGRSLGFACAAWLEHEGATAEAAPALTQARETASQALTLQAAHPTDIHHVIEALAWLACRLGDAPAAALLAAGGRALRQALQAGRNALDERLAARVQAHLQQLPEPQRSDCARTAAQPWRADDGSAPDDAEALARPLRQWALDWLQARGG